MTVDHIWSKGFEGTKHIFNASVNVEQRRMCTNY